MAFARDAEDGWGPGDTTAGGLSADAGGFGSAGKIFAPAVRPGEPPSVTASVTAAAVTAAAAPTASCGHPSRRVTTRPGLTGRRRPGSAVTRADARRSISAIETGRTPRSISSWI